MLVRKSIVAVGGIYVAGVALSLAGPSLLPANYYFDAETIREAMRAPDALLYGASFNNTALAYRALGFGALFPDAAAAIFSFSAAYFAVIAASGLAHAAWRPWLFALLGAWTVPLAVYDGTYSKEVLAVVIVSLVTHLARSARGVVAGAALALVYALLFRTYWGVVLVLWLAMLVAWRAGTGWSIRLLAAVLMIVPLSFAAHHFADLWLTDARTIVMEARDLTADAATMFANPWPNESAMTDVANALAGWFALVLPAYLVSLGGLQHVAFGAFQFANTSLFAAAMVRNARSRDARFDWRFASAATFCVAYSLVQGMFEPDFGSFAKHETTLLPMIFYVLVQTWARRDVQERSSTLARASLAR